jgi:tripartite-type tricarboxylate transporter receptor subunit TctC
MKASVRKAAALWRPAAPRNSDRRVLGPHPRRQFLRLAAGTAVLPAVSRVAWAQAYPSRPVTMIVPLGAGSSGDAVGRLVAERMGRALGQSIIVENVAGADGVGRVARARPDGYTIELGNSSRHMLNGALYSLAYDVLKHFAPISPLATNPLVLFA